MITINQIIKKKADGLELSAEEIHQFIDGVAQKTIPDYLITALLMAIYIKKISIQESYYLTKEICAHGASLDFNHQGIIIDKHSTGGVGDKTTLILTPLLACLHLSVAKIAGRGLGFTGGTLDKFDAIGVNTNLTLPQMQDLLVNEHMFIGGQTKDITPVDKVLYHLRDVTNTVKNTGLIASSILSKKFSLKGTHVYIDMKCGTGAFFETQEEIDTFTKYMLEISTLMKRKITIIMSDMNQPLGKAIGNSLEVHEAIDFLSGNYDQYPDLKELIFTFASQIMLENMPNITKEQAWAKIKQVLDQKLALEKFYHWMVAQGADKQKVISGQYLHPQYHLDVCSNQEGYLSFAKVNEIGVIANRLGAGRILKTDPIDYDAGIIMHKKYGDKVQINDVIATFYSSKPINQELAQDFLHNCRFSNTPLPKLNVIKGILSNVETN